jgi:hypothetical protein
MAGIIVGVNEEWRQSWLVWLAAVASAVFLVLWWAVDDTFVWGFVVFAFLTAVVRLRETQDWRRSPLAWSVWLVPIVFWVLWIAVEENFKWPFFGFLFLGIAMRAREARPVRGDQSPRSR